MVMFAKPSVQREHDEQWFEIPIRSIWPDSAANEVHAIGSPFSWAHLSLRHIAAGAPRRRAIGTEGSFILCAIGSINCGLSSAWQS
jgi:hypothetical protein